jgi:hypothetical protein
MSDDDFNELLSTRGRGCFIHCGPAEGEDNVTGVCCCSSVDDMSKASWYEVDGESRVYFRDTEMIVVSSKIDFTDMDLDDVLLALRNKDGNLNKYDYDAMYNYLAIMRNSDVMGKYCCHSLGQWPFSVRSTTIIMGWLWSCKQYGIYKPPVEEEEEIEEPVVTVPDTPLSRIVSCVSCLPTDVSSGILSVMAITTQLVSSRPSEPISTYVEGFDTFGYINMITPFDVSSYTSFQNYTRIGGLVPNECDLNTWMSTTCGNTPMIYIGSGAGVEFDKYLNSHPESRCLIVSPKPLEIQACVVAYKFGEFYLYDHKFPISFKRLGASQDRSQVYTDFFREDDVYRNHDLETDTTLRRHVFFGSKVQVSGDRSSTFQYSRSPSREDVGFVTDTFVPDLSSYVYLGHGGGKTLMPRTVELRETTHVIQGTFIPVSSDISAKTVSCVRTGKKFIYALSCHHVYAHYSTRGVVTSVKSYEIVVYDFSLVVSPYHKHFLRKEYDKIPRRFLRGPRFDQKRGPLTPSS